MAAKPASVADYLDALPADRRDRFERLRAAVRAAAPDADEVISYDMPAYRVGGRYVCSIGSYANHDSLFPATRTVIERLGDEVAPYVKGRGTFQFPAREPLPLELVGRIVPILVEERVPATAAEG